MIKLSNIQRGLVVPSVFGLMTFVGCGISEVDPRISDPETEPTQISHNLNSSETKDGVLTYRMTTPLLEHYELAEEPFIEFRKGIEVKTYNDSTREIESEIRADYAKYIEPQKLWEARGNVIAINHKGDRTLYTEKLWWNEKLDKIYSDTLVRVVEGKGEHIGYGFEADGEFTQWVFRRPRGQMSVELKKDSTSVDTLPARDTLVSPSRKEDSSYPRRGVLTSS